MAFRFERCGITGTAPRSRARARLGASEAGYPLATRRLLDLRRGGRIEMPLAEATDLYVQLARTPEAGKAVSALAMLEHDDPDIQQAVSDRVDIRAVYERAAAEGDPAAQVELARAIRRKADGPGALTEYANLLTSAAEQGHAEAMLLLSQAYAYGAGISPSPELSRRWLLRAAEAGNAEAQETARMLTIEKGQTE